MGDMNADISRTDGVIRSKFGKEIVNFCDENHLVLSDMLHLDPETFTHYSEAHHSVSWLDHCISTFNFHRLITDIKVIRDVICSDHLPVSVRLNCGLCDVQPPIQKDTSCRTPPVSWSNVTDANVERYKSLTRVALQSVSISRDLIHCTDTTCTSVDHRSLIDSLYQDIVCGLLSSSKQISRAKCDNRHTHQVIPGWNQFCKEAHEQAREAFLLWCSHGKPKQGPIFTCMCRTRANFKYALRYCRKNESSVLSDKLAAELSEHDYSKFWKNINSINNKKTPLSNTVGGASGSADITDMWREHFKALLNSIDASKTDVHRQNVTQTLHNVAHDDNCMFTAIEVTDAIKLLKTGKAAGADGLSSEHYKYADHRLAVLMSIFFQCAVTHGYFPSDFMNSTIVPLIKNKSGDITDKNNYRPIALSTMSSNIFERILLGRYDDLLYSMDNQFGYKKNLSTDLCVYSFK